MIPGAYGVFLRFRNSGPEQTRVPSVLNEVIKKATWNYGVQVGCQEIRAPKYQYPFWVECLRNLLCEFYLGRGVKESPDVPNECDVTQRDRVFPQLECGEIYPTSYM